MFVALRDLRFARGRFALMAAVIVLMTALIGLVSGLTAGLSRDSTAAIDDLGVGSIAFAAPAPGQGVSFTDSTVTASTWRQWAKQPGVVAVAPLGILTGRLAAKGRTATVTVFGVEPGGPLVPSGARPGSGTVVVSTSVAHTLGLRIGDPVTVGRDTPMRVGAIITGATFSHTPVIWTTLSDWQAVSGAPKGHLEATVIGLNLRSGTDVAKADAALGTHTVSRSGADAAIPGYTSENGSLQLMRVFLFAISALVVGAFFTVWTMQRNADIAVLKALGASNGYLLRDALGQALIVLVSATVIGTGIADTIGALVSGTVPFVTNLSTTLLPLVVLVVLGMLGAALAIRRVTAVDPLTALGAAR